MIHRDFEDALEDFRISGGAMVYHPADGDPAGWEACDYGDVPGEALEATRRAMEAGGMTDRQIAEELGDWQA